MTKGIFSVNFVAAGVHTQSLCGFLSTDTGYCHNLGVCLLVLWI